MDKNIDQIFSNKVDMILDDIIEDYNSRGYFAEKEMRGPTMSPSKALGGRISSERNAPKHRRSIVISTDKESIHITIYYSEGTKDILVGPVFPKPIGGNYTHIKLDQIDELLESTVREKITI